MIKVNFIILLMLASLSTVHAQMKLGKHSDYNEEHLLKEIRQKTQILLDKEKSKIQLERIPVQYRPFVTKIFSIDSFTAQEQAKISKKYNLFVKTLAVKSSKQASLSMAKKKEYRSFLGKYRSGLINNSYAQFDENVKTKERINEKKYLMKKKRPTSLKDSHSIGTNTEASKMVLDSRGRLNLILKKYSLDHKKIKSKYSIFEEHKKNYYLFIQKENKK